MSLIDELNAWKEDLEALGVEKAKAEGRLDQAREKLKSLGFDTVEEAEAEVKRLNEEKLIAEAQAKKMLEDFKVKYADFIEQEP